VKGEKNILGIPVVEDYKYLGITINYTLSIDKYIEQLKDDLRKTSKMINILIMK